MKRFALAIALLFSIAATAQVQPDYSKLSGHPRLILKQGDIEAVHQKIAADQPLRVMHRHIENKANRLLKVEPMERKMTGKRMLSCSRAVLERVCFCSYMYLVSGKEEYADRAEEEMLSAARYSDWNPKHYLDVGEMTAV